MQHAYIGTGVLNIRHIGDFIYSLQVSSHIHISRAVWLFKCVSKVAVICAVIIRMHNM